jgi:DNA-binding transcriptional ArsR family regulator
MTQLCKSSGSRLNLAEIIPQPLFRALCDPNRMALLASLLREPGPVNVSQASACCPVDLSVVSRHLAILRDAGAVKAERRGREVFYSVRVDHLTRLLRSLADALDACCPPSPTAAPANPVRNRRKKGKTHV